MGIFSTALNISPSRLSRSDAPGEVALNLRLVGAEVRQREKEAAQQARPEGVAPVHVNGEINALQLVKPAGQGQGVRQTHSGRHPGSKTTKAASMPQKMTPSWYFCVTFTA